MQNYSEWLLYWAYLIWDCPGIGENMNRMCLFHIKKWGKKRNRQDPRCDTSWAYLVRLLLCPFGVHWGSKLFKTTVTELTHQLLINWHFSAGAGEEDNVELSLRHRAEKGVLHYSGVLSQRKNCKIPPRLVSVYQLNTQLLGSKAVVYKLTVRKSFNTLLSAAIHLCIRASIFSAS